LLHSLIVFQPMTRAQTADDRGVFHRPVLFPNEGGHIYAVYT
jgi:hypothetical protein